MDQFKLLISKGILVSKMIRKGEELRKQWEVAFASHLSQSKKDKFIYISIYGTFLAITNFAV